MQLRHTSEPGKKPVSGSGSRMIPIPEKNPVSDPVLWGLNGFFGNLEYKLMFFIIV